MPGQRLAEGYEKLRRLTDQYQEKHGHRPGLFLLNMGPLIQHKARADFTQGFFQSGGFEVIYPDGFDGPASAADAFLASGARVGVICSTDANYPELVPPLLQSIKEKDSSLRVLLAGHPGEHADTFKEAGLDDFISIKSNHFETLVENLKYCGVYPS